MSTLIDEVGRVYGRLTVICRAPSRSGRAFWLCSCSCGGVHEAAAPHLRSGAIRSCGCLRKDAGVSKLVHGHARKTVAKSLTYSSWSAMWVRVNNPKATGFYNWGGRGIRICERWRDFTSFLKDMGERPSGCSIERLNNDGDYEPGNCIWATCKEQARNRRNTIWLTYDGFTMSLSEWATVLNIPYHTLYKRLRNNWDIEKAMTHPLRNIRRRDENPNHV